MKKGDTVSYGSTAIIGEKSISAGTIPLGYADGIPRALSNNVFFNNHPLLGRVTMDQIIVGNVNGNAPVELIGPNTPPLESWASKSQTVTYEILTGFGNRIRRSLGV